MHKLHTHPVRHYLTAPQSQHFEESQSAEWTGLHSFHNSHDLIHIPSLSIDLQLVKNIDGVHFYEERSLAFILHLNNPENRVIYVTSHQVPQVVIDYYLGLLTNVDIEDARSRLFMFACYDTSFKPLSEKILERPLLLQRIREVINPERTVLSCFIHSDYEDKISQYLGIAPAHLASDYHFWGSKCGSRITFREVGCPHATGNYESLENIEDLVAAIDQLKQDNPDIKTIMIKLNEGVSGFGNAFFNIPQGRSEAILESLVQDLRPCSGDSSSQYLDMLSKFGAIIEEYLPYEIISCPSVQGFITAEGKCEIISTHEQVLNGQIYEGCIFPCKDEYRKTLHEHCQQIGEFLASKGGMDQFGVDFVSWRDPETGKTEIEALEINLRQLGTTHPMMTLRLLTQGDLTDSGDYVDSKGRRRCYMASEHLQSDIFKGITPIDLNELIESEPELQFNQNENIGVVFHMWDSLSMYGKAGLVCIGATEEEVLQKFQSVSALLEDLVCKKVQEASSPELPTF